MNKETPPSAYTLKDIAREAGVSVATVDRVLHGRSGVRADTARRVSEAVARHDFRPLRAGAELSRARAMKFALVMPSGENIFMQLIRDQVAGMSGWLASRRVAVETIITDVFNPAVLAQTLESLTGRFDGVAVVALDHQNVRAAVDDLVEGGMFVVTLVSDVPGSRRHYYVGVDNVAAGRTAGALIGRLTVARTGKIGVIAGSRLLRDHAERIFGFQQVIGLEYPNLKMIEVVEGGDKDDLNETLMVKLIAEHPDLIGVYNVGAGTPGVGAAIAKAGRENHVVFIAHDFTPYTRRCLLRGIIDAIISQDPGHEAMSAIRLLLGLVRREPALAEQEKIRIGIIMRDNLP
ncbi:MAG: LacI family DNA-binding transcriptional regulator [Bradyrhizobium sp.]|nr:MAG: LacI family DNA-binding transcriptional regulator [Bradyrhizobium sp.]